MDKRFDELYHLYAKDIYRIVYSYLLNEPDSEDVIQKTFIKLYNNKQKLSLPDEDVKRWLFRVAINEAKDILRSPWKKFISKLDINHTNVSNEKEDTLIDSLNNIASEYRIPLYLFYYEGYSIKEIAALLHKSESAIKMRLSRGKEKLKMEVEETI